MAIQISKEVKYKGIKVPSLYGRVAFSISLDASTVTADLYFFVDKQSYKESIDNALTSRELNTFASLELSYDPVKDGVDLLSFVHQKLLHILTTDISHEDRGKKVITRKKLCGINEFDVVDLPSTQF